MTMVNKKKPSIFTSSNHVYIHSLTEQNLKQLNGEKWKVGYLFACDCGLFVSSVWNTAYTFHTLDTNTPQPQADKYSLHFIFHRLSACCSAAWQRGLPRKFACCALSFSISVFFWRLFIFYFFYFIFHVFGLCLLILVFSLVCLQYSK